jgi:aminoglycoside 6'-N-acetyltransferase I
VPEQLRASTIKIRPVQPGDASAWLSMRCALWPEGSEEEHRGEIDRFFAGQLREPLAVLLAEGSSGRPVGFAELSIRSYAEGCHSDRVAYLEGWFVESPARRRGIGRALIEAAEASARVQGCIEFASDTQPSNEVGAAAHRALGFSDVGMVRCFRKEL